MFRRAPRIAALAVTLGAVGALPFTSTAAAAAFSVELSVPFRNWVVTGSLTPKKLNEPVVLPKGSTFNGVAHLRETSTEVSGAVAGKIFVPPFKTSLKLAGLVPTTVGVTFTEVGESEGTIVPGSGCPETMSPCGTLNVTSKADVGITETGLLGVEVPTECETSEPIVFHLSDTLSVLEMQRTGPRFSGTVTIPSVQCGGLSGLAVGLLLTELMSGPENPYKLHISLVEPAAPEVVTGTATAVSQISGTLNATVNPLTEPVTSCELEYGTSTSYGASVPCASSPGEGDEPAAVSAQATGLGEGTTYHYRILATNTLGTSYGADQTFTTLSSSVAPEYGRCVEQKKGEYTNASCTEKSAKANKGAYEWAPGPAPTCVAQKKGEYTNSSCTIKSTKAKKGSDEKAPGPAYTSKSGTATLHVPALGRTITCAASTGAGEVTGSRSAAERVTFTGCETSGKRCTSEGADGTPSGTAGVIVTNLLATRPIGPVGEEVWTELASGEHEPYTSEFACAGALFRTSGSLAGVQSGDVGAMSATSTTAFALGEGAQGLEVEVSETEGKSWLGPDPASEVAVFEDTAASQTEIRP